MAAPSVILLMSAATYRAGAFTSAAERIGLPAIPAVDLPEPLAERYAGRLALDFHDTAATGCSGCSRTHVSNRSVAGISVGASRALRLLPRRAASRSRSARSSAGSDIITLGINKV